MPGRDHYCPLRGSAPPHPVAGVRVASSTVSVLSALLFEVLRLASDRTIDTTGMNVHELARTRAKCLLRVQKAKPTLTVMSFGFQQWCAFQMLNYMAADMRLSRTGTGFSGAAPPDWSGTPPGA